MSNVSHLSLFWFPTKLCAFLTGSRSDRLLKPVLGYVTALLSGWCLTVGTYYVINNYMCPINGAEFKTRLPPLVAKLNSHKFDANLLADGGVDIVFKSKDKKTDVARVTIFVIGSGQTLDEIYVELEETSKSLLPRRVVLFKRAPEFPSWLFKNTHSIQLPASVHALQKAIGLFMTQLAEAPAIKNTLDMSDPEARGKALSEIIKNTFEDLGPVVNWNRRFNGYIQFLTVMAFWIAMVQIFARYWLHCHLEYAIRHHASVREIWDVGNDLLDDDETKALEKRCSLAKVELEHKSQVAIGGIRLTFARSAYLDLFHAAVAAFRVESDYKAVPAFVDSRAATIGDERNAGLGLIKYLIWSIPSLGFVGTVVGIGDALLETVNVDSADVAQAAIAKSLVSSSIGVAFDTTLVALLLSLIAMLCYNLLLQFENLTIFRAATDAEQRFVKPSRAISRDQLAVDLVVAINDAAQGARDLKKVGKTLRSNEITNAEVLSFLTRAKRMLSIQLCAIILLAIMVGFLVFKLMRKS